MDENELVNNLGDDENSSTSESSDDHEEDRDSPVKQAVKTGSSRQYKEPDNNSKSKISRKQKNAFEKKIAEKFKPKNVNESSKSVPNEDLTAAGSENDSTSNKHKEIEDNLQQPEELMEVDVNSSSFSKSECSSFTQLNSDLIPTSDKAIRTKLIVIKKPLPPGMASTSNKPAVRKITIKDFEKLGKNKISRSSGSSKISSSSKLEKTSGNSPVYRCQKCHLLFTEHSKYIEHMQEHKYKNDDYDQSGVDLSIYPCGVCEKKFPAHAAAMEHIKIAHAKRLPMKCGLCSYETFIKENFEKHARMHLRFVEKRFANN